MNTTESLGGNRGIEEMDKSREEQIRKINEEVSHKIDFGSYGFLKFQKGPRVEVGVNGLFIAEDVIPSLIKHLQEVNAVLPSRETSLAITKFEEGNMWLLERRRKREAQGVLGTYKGHK